MCNGLILWESVGWKFKKLVLVFSFILQIWHIWYIEYFFQRVSSCPVIFFKLYNWSKFFLQAMQALPIFPLFHGL